MRLGWLGVLVLLAALTACGGSDDESAARDAAQEQADRYTSGDYAGAWDMWTDDAKAAISQADYVRLRETCEGSGVHLKVSSVRIDGNDATVRLAVGDFEQAYTMHLEGGEWRWQPTDDAMSEYALGVDGAIEAERADGSCA